jgi:hypothetical protein
MNLEKFLVIAGVPGVHKLIASRNNGLLIEDRQEGRTRFVPVRQQQITPLMSVSIYTETEEGTIPLVDVFGKMLDQRETNPPVSPDASSAELRDYFSRVLPEHDRDRVHIHDIKKCLKWFKFMLDKGIFEEARREESAASAADPAAVTETSAPAGTDVVEEAQEAREAPRDDTNNPISES